MEEDSIAQGAPALDREELQEPAVSNQSAVPDEDEVKPAGHTRTTRRDHRVEHGKRSKKHRTRRSRPATYDSSSDESTQTSEGSQTSYSEDDGSSEEERLKRKRRSKKQKAAKKAKGKKTRKHRQVESSSDDATSDSEESAETSSEEEVSKRKKSKKAKRVVETDSEEEETADDSRENALTDLQTQLEALKLQILTLTSASTSKKRSKTKSSKRKRKSSSRKIKEDGSSWKRVDHLWDASIHNWKVKESAEDDDSEFSEYAFLVRRCFDWENKYLNTKVDIKSKQLRSVLAEVMKDCKSVSLETEEPVIDPNTLFLYLEPLRTHYQKTLKAAIRAEKKRKVVKKLEKQRSLCKTLVKYIDEDYADTKKTLYPLLAAGNITFELLWALYRPNDIAITSCYGAWDEPRCFKIDYAHKNCTMMRGEWYTIEGKYMEFDGKNFGLGNFEADVEAFKGPRKITSLACYPLQYHKDPTGVKKQIIERGRHFLELGGMNYRFHKGLAFHKKKKQVLKVSINGRVMIDPATFRRINPNYPISYIKPHEDEDVISNYSSEDECSCCADGSDNGGDVANGCETLDRRDQDGNTTRTKTYFAELPNGEVRAESVEVDEDGQIIRSNTVVGEELEPASLVGRKFTEEELLLTSPVVYGFAFNEKLWLEFTVSGIRDIEYNNAAFDSLVLPPNQKSIVRALVESHKFHAAKTIDDVVQGKGKGLVAVLHGPPGTGKTLTAEGISELLHCPLYMVSAGELGTDPAKLELELQKILDIAHSWGAVLLLDEADVFLEKREVHDIHRNALVSIFLRLLEYFQGILFLTTNRVETFDDAFQSRIHVALRYGELAMKAKRSVWAMFLNMCRAQAGCAVADFSDEQLDALSRHQLNGRQIKNIVRTAQALALRDGDVLGMEHVKKVMDVQEDFERDLKGGLGYLDAMRSYT